MAKIMRIAFFLILLGLGAAAFMGVRMLLAGGGNVIVPDVKGKGVEDAMGLAQKVGLVVKVEAEVESPVAKGLIVQQTPKSGESVKPGRSINVTISKGGEQIPLPDLRGLAYDKALSSITENGFIVGDVVRVHHGLVPAGDIVAQSPSAPMSLLKGSKVDLLVSLGGSGQGQTPVPDILGKSRQDGINTLKKAGLRVGDIIQKQTNMTAPGMIMATSPRPGVEVTPGSKVNITVAAAPEPGSSTSKPSGSQGELTVIGTTIPGVEPTPADGQSPLVVIPPSDGGRTTPAEEPTPTPQQNKKPVGKKIAKLVYQVPPILKPMEVKVIVVDSSGQKVFLKKTCNGGEPVKLDIPYDGEIAVQIYLGGEFVWEERYL